MDDSIDWSTLPHDCDLEATSSTLRAANETHRLCSTTRDAVVEAEKRLAEMTGEMRTIEKSYLDRNKELTEEKERVRRRAQNYKNENSRLKRQILRLMELDDIKNDRIEEMEKRLDDFCTRIEKRNGDHLLTADRGSVEMADSISEASDRNRKIRQEHETEAEKFLPDVSAASPIVQNSQRRIADEAKPQSPVNRSRERTKENVRRLEHIASQLTVAGRIGDGLPTPPLSDWISLLNSLNEEHAREWRTNEPSSPDGVVEGDRNVSDGSGKRHERSGSQSREIAFDDVDRLKEEIASFFEAVQRGHL